jgi:opacity protein-like surface antigen
MRSMKYLLAATAASLLSTAALAADLPIAPPPAYAPPPPADFGGWYLRGDIGMTNQQLKSLDNADPIVPTNRVATGMGFDSATLFDIGVGYQFNNWFRADIIGQYRGRANFHGSESFNNGTVYSANNYSGSKSETLVMANAYVDLGTWWCVTPFIGAGVGTSYNRISGFQDAGIANSFGVPQPFSLTYAADAGKWNFAWAAHAGLAYKVSPSLTVELAYSYMDLGSATTGANMAYDGSPARQYPWTMNHITSNDLKLGVRWSLDPTPVYMPRPLITKG